MNAVFPSPDTSAQAPAAARDCQTVAFILLPGFDLLSLTAGLEPLRAANRLAGREWFRPVLASWDGLPVPSAQGWPIPVEIAVDKIQDADLTFVYAGDMSQRHMPAGLPDHLRRQWRLGRTVGAVNGGIFALAKAGILSGHRFTLHRDHQPIFSSRWPELEPEQDIFCIDRRIITCAGGVAMADLALRLVCDRCGPQIAAEAMQSCLITTPRGDGVPQTAALAPRVNSRNPCLIRAVKWIDDNFLDPDCLRTMPDAAGTSARQLQRLFKAHLDTRPLQYLTDLRLNHGRALLAETNISMQAVAMICGYDSPGTFSKAFRRKFGTAPSKFSLFGV